MYTIVHILSMAEISHKSRILNCLFTIAAMTPPMPTPQLAHAQRGTHLNVQWPELWRAPWTEEWRERWLEHCPERWRKQCVVQWWKQVEIQVEVECRIRLTTQCATQFNIQLTIPLPVLS